jgi:hypothetical protein
MKLYEHMRHLTSGEFVDLIEGLRTESSAAHLDTCEACRTQLADLRAMMSQAAAIDVPEPSPLFWDHLASRVREAVVAEGARGRSWFDWAPQFTTPMAAGALVALVLAALITMRINLGRDSSSAGSSSGGAVAISGALSDDPSLALVMELAADLDSDSAAAAGLTASLGSTDNAVARLNANERRELGRLLTEAMAKPGA